MRDEFLEDMLQHIPAEQDVFAQTLLFDGAYETLRERVEIRRPRWCFDGFIGYSPFLSAVKKYRIDVNRPFVKNHRPSTAYNLKPAMRESPRVFC